MPTLIVWGRRDPLIPARHAGVAQRAMPGSRLEVFDDVGHFPQLAEPVRFAQVLREFIDDTEPATADEETLRARMLAGP
jgi:pimeloyl-ACP methyl ester carboxylesterase